VSLQAILSSDISAIFFLFFPSLLWLQRQTAQMMRRNTIWSDAEAKTWKSCPKIANKNKSSAKIHFHFGICFY